MAALALLLVAGPVVAGNPIDDFEKNPSPYKTAKMFAYCAAQYQAAALMAESVPEVAEQYRGVARGATTVGAFTLWLERARKVEAGTAIQDGVKRDLKFFSDMLDEWTKTYVDAYAARLAGAEELGDLAEGKKVLGEITTSIEDCIERTNKLQTELVESMREFMATM